METFALFAVCTSLVWVVYWAILRPTLMSTTTDELAALKIRMDWAIIEGAQGAQSELARQLDYVLINGVGMAHFITFGQLVTVSYINRKSLSLQREELRRKFEESPAWLRDMQNVCARTFVKAALLNSPFWWPFLPFILFSTLLSNQASAWWQDVQYASSDVLRKNAGAQNMMIPTC